MGPPAPANPTNSTIKYYFKTSKTVDTVPYAIKAFNQTKFTLAEIKKRNPKGPEEAGKFKYFFKTTLEGCDIYDPAEKDSAEVPYYKIGQSWVIFEVLCEEGN